MSLDGSLRLWDINSGREIAFFPALGEPRCLSFSPDGLKIICGDMGWNVYILRLRGGYPES
jgi:WD40 repeat protein